jgi:hypothetical protein
MLTPFGRRGGGKMADWQRVTEGLGHGGYVAWEAAIAKATSQAGREHLPVFAALHQMDGMSLAEAIDATLALPDLRFSRHERDLLVTERALAAGGGWPHEVRLVAFCPRSRIDSLPPFWRLIEVGPPLLLPDAADPAPGQDLRATEGDLDPRLPVAAVIDDGIAFLNARFRANPRHTRIRAVWLQASDALSAGDVVCGQVLTGPDIDAHLATGGEEAEVYAQVNRALHPVTDGALTNRRVAHGTHVLDLAAGAAPWGADAMRDLPILAVQLPPQSVRDTAGRRMETYLVQGLRWLLSEALRQAHGTDVPPMVVNISLGSLAGPGDSHAFLADWLKHEVARHARLTGGAKLRLVIAYGNARLARLVARGELRLSQPMELIWRTLPDDHTSSHLEIRTDASMVQGLQVTLTPPSGSGLPVLEVPWPARETGWQLAGPVAALSSIHEPGGTALLHLALGPTIGLPGLPACPPGGWRVALRTTEAEPVRVTARVQRDDTPFGYRTLGRQSWLDHPQGWEWDTEARGYLAPRAAADAPGCPVTREGSAVAYAGADDPAILFVAAGRPVTGQPDQLRPSSYSSEGARHLARPGESLGPTLAARGDDGVMLAGRRAAGILSGSVTRLSGTSVAAPDVARSLLCYFRNTPADQQSESAERRALTGKAAVTTPDPRMGQGALQA